MVILAGLEAFLAPLGVILKPLGTRFGPPGGRKGGPQCSGRAQGSRSWSVVGPPAPFLSYISAKADSD